jgi:3-dehydrosphinganine reductase
LELAKKLGEQGANICILARHPEQLEAAKQEIEKVSLAGSKVSALTVDVTDSAQIKAAVGKLIENAGVPDMLINSAGVIFPGEFQQQDPDLFRKTLDINFFGSVNVIWSLLPGMTARGSGKIINIGSLLSFVGIYGYTAYCASKYALRGFSDALRTEMRFNGIQVHLVLPTDTQTPQLEFEQKHKPERAKAFYKLLGARPPMGADMARAAKQTIGKK